ncbi:MAG: VWA domain-containing protein [Bacilli bacterium]
MSKLFTKKSRRLFMSTVYIKQILLLTDGHSNQGIRPEVVSTLALEQNVRVNVVGIGVKEQDANELLRIALCGGGNFEIAERTSLAEAVVSVSRSSFDRNIHDTVLRDVARLVGDKVLTPTQQKTYEAVVSRLSEEASVSVVILIDTSGSMETHMTAVFDAIQSLIAAYPNRIMFKLCSFPGKYEAAVQHSSWRKTLEEMPALVFGGLTPTGPALYEALSHFRYKYNLAWDAQIQEL